MGEALTAQKCLDREALIKHLEKRVNGTTKLNELTHDDQCSLYDQLCLQLPQREFAWSRLQRCRQFQTQPTRRKRQSTDDSKQLTNTFKKQCCMERVLSDTTGSDSDHTINGDANASNTEKTRIKRPHSPVRWP